MSQQMNMNVFLYSLLVTHKMDDFTVAEAKDALVKEHSEFTDEVEARKFVYRQLTRNVEKGMLKRTDCFKSGDKKVIYSKTEKFFNTKIVPSVRSSKKKPMTMTPTLKESAAVDYQEELKKELATYTMDLDTILEEAKEYKRLSVRFPELQNRLNQHQSQAKKKSIQLLGKVHALQNLLGYTVTGEQSC